MDAALLDLQDVVAKNVKILSYLAGNSKDEGLEFLLDQCQDELKMALKKVDEGRRKEGGWGTAPDSERSEA